MHSPPQAFFPQIVFECSANISNPKKIPGQLHTHAFLFSVLLSSASLNFFLVAEDFFSKKKKFGSCSDIVVVLSFLLLYTSHTWHTQLGSLFHRIVPAADYTAPPECPNQDSIRSAISVKCIVTILYPRAAQFLLRAVLKLRLLPPLRPLSRRFNRRVRPKLRLRTISFLCWPTCLLPVMHSPPQPTSTSQTRSGHSLPYPCCSPSAQPRRLPR